jgi:hypothetical protein
MSAVQQDDPDGRPHCGTCRFWRQQGIGHGLCRRGRPQVQAVALPAERATALFAERAFAGRNLEIRVMSHFPPTNVEEWCGEWEAV